MKHHEAPSAKHSAVVASRKRTSGLDANPPDLTKRDWRSEHL